jgi:L-glyceraldehyde 3-phosphate reductase
VLGPGSFLFRRLRSKGSLFVNRQPKPERYASMKYNRCGRSGLMLPAVSLGLWHNFGGVDPCDSARHIVLEAFDMGITYFDLANNYGPPPGSAEHTFGEILKQDLAGHRDELVIATKAGYKMWDGPYGEWGSRKYLLSSLEQSLRRLGLGYVDIFYSHRFDPHTPLEETMGALDSAVRQGKSLYVGVSNYDAAQTAKAAAILKDLGTPCVVHQPSYSMFNRQIEHELIALLDREGIGCAAFGPLAQGLLSDRYLEGIPPDSRAANPHGWLKKEQVTEAALSTVRRLRDIAIQRGQSMAQMALAWALRDPRMTAVVVGASSVTQLRENVAALERPAFTQEELQRIEQVLE